MKTIYTPLERRIRKSALLVTIGLAITLASLLIFHPLSFVGFIVLGVILMLLANVYFLYAVLRGNRGSVKQNTATVPEP